MLFTAVALTACGNNESLDALELLELSHEAQAEALADGFIPMTVDVEMDVEIDMDGITMTMPVTMRIEVESEERMSMETSMEMMGQEMNMTMFLRDGYEYSEEPDPLTGQVERNRSEASSDITEAMEMAEMFELNFDDASDDWFENTSAERTDDGYRLEFSLSMEGLTALVGDLDLPGMEEMEELFNLDNVDDDNVDDDDFDYTLIMYLDEDYMPILTTLAFDVSMTVEEAGMSMDMTMAMTMTLRIEDVTIDFPDWLDEVAAGPNFEDSALIGYWEGGSGRVFLWVFNRADSVEFFADGTLIITEAGSRDIVEWELVAPGSFIADGEAFTYVIHGDVLTITDRASDDWSFYREGTAPVIEDNDDDDDDDDDEDDDDDDNGDTTTTGSSASDFDASDWRAFLEEYEELVIRANENPADLSILNDVLDWSERADEIMENLDLNDMLEFLDELLRIMELIEL